METIKSDLIIIGAGLTGLTLAYLLRAQNLQVSIVEARDRLGGRILTSYEDGNAPIEMGATWLGSKHTELNALLQELGLAVFEQILGQKAIYEPISTSPHQLVTLPPNNEPSFRIKGGTSTLIQSLASTLKANQIHLNQVVQSIQALDSGLEVSCSNQVFRAPIVVSTLPPHLLLTRIKLMPELPSSLISLMKQTHTWMGESIKVGLRFAAPFWRKPDSSGTIFSNVGPIPEMYDHADFEDQSYALKGFLNGAYYSMSKADRLKLVLMQLRKYYGKDVEQYLEYEEAVWRTEPFTYAPYEGHVLPHQNNGHRLYHSPYLNGKLFIAGAETAAQFPGYMEGAVRSAQHVYDTIKAQLG
ncbi:MAG: FAD-dependent oxidoreductase [Saprospiraceae bacterium]|nr:FAD-dependent oxidoreductase [Saprospiraceae bacterium]